MFQLRWKVAALLASLGLTCAVQAATNYPAGQIFLISRDVEAVEKGSDGSSSSSSDRDTIEEQVIGSSQAGTELAYDLPKDTSAEDRARQWQLPARVLRSPSGSLQLLNRAELAVRAKAWLKAAGLTEAACGHWYFTWNAFKIECDPQSVVDTIEGFDLGPDNLSAGTPYRDRLAIGPAPLKNKAGESGSNVLYVEMALDPDAARRDEAQADVVAAEIMRKPVNLETALRTHSAEEISGTIAVTFEVDADGHARRQTKVTAVKIKSPDGRVKTRTVTQTLERRPIARPRA